MKCHLGEAGNSADGQIRRRTGEGGASRNGELTVSVVLNIQLITETAVNADQLISSAPRGHCLLAGCERDRVAGEGESIGV